MGNPNDSGSGSGVRKSIACSLRSMFGSKRHSSSNNPFDTPKDDTAQPPPPSYQVAVSEAVAAVPDSPSGPSGSAPAPLVPAHSSQHLSPYQAQNPDSDITNDSLTSLEDPYAFLARYDTIFLVDDSGSMIGPRWRQVATVLNQIVPVCAEHDQDGVDIEFLNSSHRFDHVKDPAYVDEVFRKVSPSNGTPTGRRIHAILDPYVTEFENRVRREGKNPKLTGMKPVNLIVITDGEPNNQEELARVLENIARRLDNIHAPLTQLGVQFFQVGEDRLATRALKRLDDELGGSYRQGKLRDIIDTVTFDTNDGSMSLLTGDAILKTVLGAVTRKFDRQVLVDQRTNKGGSTHSFERF